MNGDDLRSLAEQTPGAPARATGDPGAAGAPVLGVVDHGVRDGSRRWTVTLLIDGRRARYDVVDVGTESAAIGRARHLADPGRVTSW